MGIRRGESRIVALFSVTTGRHQGNRWQSAAACAQQHEVCINLRAYAPALSKGGQGGVALLADRPQNDSPNSLSGDRLLRYGESRNSAPGPFLQSVVALRGSSITLKCDKLPSLGGQGQPLK